MKKLLPLHAMAENTAGACLKRKHAHRKKSAFTGELRLCHREWTKQPVETIGMRYKNVNLKSRTQKWMESVGCLGQKKTLNDNPYYDFALL